MDGLTEYRVVLRVTLVSIDDWPLIEWALGFAINRVREGGHRVSWARGFPVIQQPIRCVLYADSEATVRQVLAAAHLPAEHVEALPPEA